MDEQRKYAIVFRSNNLVVRKLSDPDLKPWPRTAAISDAIQSAEQILEQVEERCRKRETT